MNASERTEEVQKLKRQAGKDILIYGSGELVNTLMRHNLIDIYLIMLHPLSLGIGKCFFRDGGGKTTLALTDAKTTNTGVVVLTYQPTGKDPEETASEQG